MLSTSHRCAGGLYLSNGHATLVGGRGAAANKSIRSRINLDELLCVWEEKVGEISKCKTHRRGNRTKNNFKLLRRVQTPRKPHPKDEIHQNLRLKEGMNLNFFQVAWSWIFSLLSPSEKVLKLLGVQPIANIAPENCCSEDDYCTLALRWPHFRLCHKKQVWRYIASN